MTGFERQKSDLLTSFKKFVFGVPSLKSFLLTCAVAFGGGMTALEFVPQMLPARGLTEGEESLLRRHFSDAVDYKKFRIHASPLADLRQNFMGAAAEALGNTLVYNSVNYHTDFSAASDVDKNLFLHEATHIWQNQNCRIKSFIDAGYHLYTRITGKKTAEEFYGYDLGRGRDLLDFNIEQQGNIIADYAVYVSRGKPVISGADAPATNTAAEYERVLENFKKNPSYPRQRCLF